jgi:hypothetical protein
MNQTGGSKIENNKILTIINYKIEQLKIKKEKIKLEIDKYNNMLQI